MGDLWSPDNLKYMLEKGDELLVNYGKKVKVGDTFLNVYTEGEGDITVVFMSGGGVTAPVLEYKCLYSRMSHKYRIAIVEKAGYGLSDSAKTERSVENLVEESRKALLLAGIKPPYVLAPHSYSGFEAVWWANNYPEEIKAILGVDMGFPDMAIAQEKEFPKEKRMKTLENQKKLFSVIAKKGFIAKLLKNKTVNTTGMMTGNALTDEEKELYSELFYKNLCNDEYSQESLLMTENAQKAMEKGKPCCPCCFFISDMKSFTKNTTWREEGIRYAKECSGEYHLTDKGHMFYSVIPQETADTFLKFLEKLPLTAENM